jgi:benzodiazapine receptor
MSALRSVIGLAAFLAACFAAAGLGSVFAAHSVSTWYQELARPSWNPPDWVFGPVWTILYTLMAVAAWLVWRRAGFVRNPWPLVWFCLQLFLNVLWSAVFFGLRSPGEGMAMLVALWLAILVTTTQFWRVRAVAGVLMLPYLAWAAFAGVLNFAIWRMNG